MSSPRAISKAIILLGGPTHQENHFRPLSLDLPKPLFPVAAREMLFHHVEACNKIPNMQEIIMIGSYDPGLFQRFFDSVQRELNISIRYMKEIKSLGTAGGIRYFKNEIMEGSPTNVFVLHCDICCTFPLQEMLRFHNRHGRDCTVLGKRVFHDEAKKYGCLVQDPDTREILHWAEKPETFVSDMINCGIYLFNARMLDQIVAVGDVISVERAASRLTHKNTTLSRSDALDKDNIRLEQDVLIPLAGQQRLYLFETGDFWCQIKTPGMAITCSEMYMQRFRYTHPSKLASTGGKNSPVIEGNVIVDHMAEVHPTAKLGPNVTIGAGVKIGAGARVAHSIILEGVTIAEHACVLFSIIGWNSSIGPWARIEGQPPSGRHANDTALSRDVTIFGVSVVADPEIIVRNCVVLPHKKLAKNYHNEILL